LLVCDKTMDEYGVVIVEDDSHAREHFSAAVQAYDRLCLLATAPDFEQGLALLRQYDPDVLLVDLGLPDGDGAELIRIISAEGLSTEAMVITVFGDERHVLAALEAGASSYLLKDDDSVQIGAAILQMMAGGAPISPAIAKHLLKRFRSPPAPVAEADNVAQLTKREQEILQLVSKGYTANEIAELCHISYHTVTTHVKRVYRKLAVNGRAEAVFAALRLGLVSKGD